MVMVTTILILGLMLITYFVFRPYPSCVERRLAVAMPLILMIPVFSTTFSEYLGRLVVLIIIMGLIQTHLYFCMMEHSFQTHRLSSLSEDKDLLNSKGQNEDY